jgi:hypothetical protein
LLIEEPSDEPLEVRNPTDEDVPTLCELWQREEQEVDMALFPGRDLLDWLSPHPAIQASVYTTLAHSLATPVSIKTNQLNRASSWYATLRWHERWSRRWQGS